MAFARHWVALCLRLFFIHFLSCSLIFACTGDYPNPDETTTENNTSQDGSSGHAEKPPIGTISSALTITPSGSFKLAVGGEVDLKVQVFNDQGIPQYNSQSNPITVTWSSSDSTVVSVSPEGLAKGLKEGSATVTAKVQGSSKQTSVSIEVIKAKTDVTAIFLTPTRLAMDISGQRIFNASAIDKFGGPTTLDCDGGGKLTFDNKYISASYDGTSGQEKISVSGTKKGYSLLTLDCGGFKSSPVIIEVKPSVKIPDPSPSANGDFGIEPSLVWKGRVTHLSSYDRANKKLIYSQFLNRWSSATLDGEGDYGRQSSIALNPNNDDLPFICAIEATGLSCWSLNGEGLWNKSNVDTIANSASGYKGRINVVVNKQGTVYVLYYSETTQSLKLAISINPSRKDWKSVEISKGGLFNDLTLASDDKPRVAFQREGKAYYGAMDSGGAWKFEAIDEGSGTPAPGTGIRLKIGSNNRPQVIYYKNGNLIHAVKAGGAWGVAVVETVNVTSYQFGLSLNRHHQPRVTYFDSSNNTLRFAYRLKRKQVGAINQWRIETPLAGKQVGNYNALTLDEFGRAHIGYYSESDKSAGYYVEPHFLDYSPTLDSGNDPLSNTLVP